jgi:hypothetical protein
MLTLGACWHFLFYLCFVFALYEGKDETQKKIKIPLRMITSGSPRCILSASTQQC